MSNSLNEKVNKTDHDLLISLSNDMSWLKKITANHLSHHWVLTIGVVGSMLSALGVLVLYIITNK